MKVHYHHVWLPSCTALRIPNFVIHHCHIHISACSYYPHSDEGGDTVLHLAAKATSVCYAAIIKASMGMGRVRHYVSQTVPSVKSLEPLSPLILWSFELKPWNPFHFWVEPLNPSTFEIFKTRRRNLKKSWSSRVVPSVNLAFVGLPNPLIPWPPCNLTRLGDMC